MLKDIPRNAAFYFARTHKKGYSIAGLLAGLLMLLAACNSAPSIPTSFGAVPSALTPQAQATGDFSPTLSVDPPGGYGGIYVRVAGSGWPPNMMVVVALADEEGRSETLASRNTDFEGNLSTGFLYPIDQRWLGAPAYQVVAATADGRHLAAAQFAVGEPGTAVAGVDAQPVAEENVTEVVAEAIPVQEDTADAATDAMVETAEGEEAEAQIAEAGEVEAEQPEAPVADAPDEETEAQSAQSEKGNDEITIAFSVEEMAGDIAVGFIPEKVKRNEGVYTVQIAVSERFADIDRLVAVIDTPPLENYREVKLKRDDDWEVKFTRNKVEIEAPNPQELRDFLHAYGGFPVQDGQRIEAKRKRNANNIELEYDDGVLEIEAAQITLRVLLIEGDGYVELAAETLVPGEAPRELPPGLQRVRAGDGPPSPPPWAAVHDRRGRDD